MAREDSFDEKRKDDGEEKYKKSTMELSFRHHTRTTGSDPHHGKIGGVKKEKSNAEDDDDNTTS